ncbi:hypothetical protein BS78_03G099300 [Paspalum vaginatum]|nr:hypothetical protein BS78_03G099300 [Paspalum vaginatum]
MDLTVSWPSIERRRAGCRSESRESRLRHRDTTVRACCTKSRPAGRTPVAGEPQPAAHRHSAIVLCPIHLLLVPLVPASKLCICMLIAIGLSSCKFDSFTKCIN